MRKSFYRGIAWPQPSEGLAITDKSIVLPNQSMSIAEILQRFTRGEPLPIGREVNYGDPTGETDFDEEIDIDLEKLRNADLTEKAEFSEKLSEIKHKADKEAKRRQKSEQQKLIAEAAKKLAEEQAKNQAQPPAK